MAHFAQVKNGIVTQVIVAEQSFINTLPDRNDWVQTSYNTLGGQHPEGRPLRKNYAGIGFLYDGVGFHAPQPFSSWTLNQDTYLWESPVPYPEDGKRYVWDESLTVWTEVTSTPE